jgi:hypothetical protein
LTMARKRPPIVSVLDEVDPVGGAAAPAREEAPVAIKTPSGSKEDTSIEVPSHAPAARDDVQHTSIYLPRSHHEAIRKLAFDQRRKPNDVMTEFIAAGLERYGYAAVALPRKRRRRR